MAQKKKFALPPQGFVFWPVGTGDTTTIVVGDEMVVQVDLHHLECSESEDDDRLPIVDRLVALLPKVGGKPYLAVFVLTHPDRDHCLGFKELLRRVQIGEIWFSPRIFREYHCDLCGDAVAFVKEAERRVAETIKAKGDVATGDTVRIIGYDELLDEDQFKGFPRTVFRFPVIPWLSSTAWIAATSSARSSTPRSNMTQTVSGMMLHRYASRAEK